MLIKCSEFKKNTLINFLKLKQKNRIIKCSDTLYKVKEYYNMQKKKLFY